MAFRDFWVKHPEAVLYIHTNPDQQSGEDLRTFIEFTGMKVGVQVFFPEQQGYKAGLYSKQHMAELYSMLDVFMLVSKGEGFGIPIIEAQACGTPVIVGEWSAMGELCGSGRIVTKEHAELFYNQMGAFWYKPHVSEITKQLEIEYKAPSNRDKARQFAVKYDADKIFTEKWLPLIEELENERI
jgi:glycosyltransferase involved in cell wall biosynthesis